jgi:hypothetical protein
VTFTLELTQHWFGWITGVVNDGPGGMPEQGRVRGRCRRQRLSFRKRMPVARIVDQKATRPLSEYVAEQGHEVPPNTPHPVILYEGRVSEDGTSLSGRWHVNEHLLPLADGRHGLPLPGYSGTWTATRGVGAAAEREDEADKVRDG